MRAKSKIQISALTLILSLSLAGTGMLQAQTRPSGQMVAVRVPSVVKIVSDSAAVSPTGLPVFRVVTNDPALRRRMEAGAEAGVIAEAMAAGLTRGGESSADFRFTVVSP
jgi:hypothetical protein